VHFTKTIDELLGHGLSKEINFKITKCREVARKDTHNDRFIVIALQNNVN